MKNLQINTGIGQEVQVGKKAKKSSEEGQEFGAALLTQLLKGTHQDTPTTVNQLKTDALSGQEHPFELPTMVSSVATTVMEDHQQPIQTVPTDANSRNQQLIAISKEPQIAQVNINETISIENAELVIANNAGDSWLGKVVSASPPSTQLDVISNVPLANRQKIPLEMQAQLSNEETNQSEVSVSIEAAEVTKLPFFEKNQSSETTEPLTTHLNSQGISTVTVEPSEKKLPTISNGETVGSFSSVTTMLVKSENSMLPSVNSFPTSTQQVALGSENEQRILQTLTKNITTTLDSAKKFTIQMNPTNLGPIKIQMKITDQKLDLVFKLQTLQTKEMFANVTERFIQILDNVKLNEHGKMQMATHFVTQENDVTPEITIKTIQPQQVSFDFFSQQGHGQQHPRQANTYLNKGKAFTASLEKIVDEIHLSELQKDGSVSILA